NAPHSLAGAAQGAMLADGQDEILAATGMKIAHLGQKRPDRDLVKAYRQNDHEASQAPNQGCQLSDHEDFFSRFSLFASIVTRRCKDFFTLTRSGSSEDRGRRTRSSPVGKEVRVKRKASRYSRRKRFRKTAGPTLLDTDNPSLRCCRPFSQP